MALVIASDVAAPTTPPRHAAAAALMVAYHAAAKKEDSRQARLRELTDSARRDCGDSADFGGVSGTPSYQHLEEEGRLFELGELLADCVCPNETLSNLVQQEAKHLSPALRSVVLPLPARAAAMHVLSELARLVHCDPATFQVMAADLEKWSLQATGEAGLRALPSALRAIAKLVYKTSRHMQYDPTIPEASAFRQAERLLEEWLVGQRYVGALADFQGSKVSEQQVAQVLGWVIDVPTVDHWLQVLLERFRVVLGGATMEKFSDWLRGQGNTLMRRLLLRASVFEFSPRSVALGLLYCGLAALDLAPPAPRRAAAWVLSGAPEAAAGFAQGLAPQTVVELAALAADTSVGELRESAQLLVALAAERVH